MKKSAERLQIGIYSPYIDMLGGGERYVFSIIQTFLPDHDVSLYTDRSIIEKSKLRFGISLEGVQCLPVSLLVTKNALNRYIHLGRYDVFFYVCDGSLFFSGAGKNILIVQSPVHIPVSTPLQTIKLRNWEIVCYSDFMKRIIEKQTGKQAYILAPAIDTSRFYNKDIKKEAIILSVGRFFQAPHSKKHDILIETFKKHAKSHFKGWRLVIAGGLTEEGGRRLVESYRKQSEGYFIEVLDNVSIEYLTDLYKRASIYWHAAGFGEDLKTHPERAEHFGITTLEAMAAGCVPVVFCGGGQKEILERTHSGLLWNTEEELASYTQKLISDKAVWQTMSKKAIVRAQGFSQGAFEKNLMKFIYA